MTGKFHFRIMGILPKKFYNLKNPDKEELLAIVGKAMNITVNFADTTWFSTYRLYHKKAARFRNDNIFLCGDAAHVHSPAGGQGMNTGLQDAYNLAWKLAFVDQGYASHALLDTYNEEREPVAPQLLKTTDRMFTYMSGENFVLAIIRFYIFPLVMGILTSSEFFRKRIFAAISQLQINYKKSSLSIGKSGNIRAGSRLPLFYIWQNNRKISSYTFVNSFINSPFRIILFNLKASGLISLPSNLFKVLEIELNPNNIASLKNIGLPKSFLILVRPDNYIGYCANKVKLAELDKLMKSGYFLLPVGSAQ
ncbi:FAD-dependent monooxygenase [Mucilaginibacter antarcticus]